MAKVFISFVHEDDAVAQAVQAVIEKSFQRIEGFGGVFLSSDRLALRHGENWMDRLKKELRECSVVVSLLSKRSIDRPWINFEAGAAWVANKLLPVCFGNLTIATMRRPYSDLTAVDLVNDPTGLIQGVNNLLTRSEQAGAGVGRARASLPATYSEDARAVRLREVLETFVDDD